jgi:hypothetical protein
MKSNQILSQHNIYKQHPILTIYENNCIKIPLINRKREVVDYALADVLNLDFLSQYSYSRTKRGYALSNKKITMHELVMGKKADKGYVIDHNDKNKLNNTSDNLHFVSAALNSQNKNKKENCSSQFIGVRIDKNTGNWVTTINLNKHRIHIGTYKDQMEAAKVYDMYAINHYNCFTPMTNNLLALTEIENIKLYGIPDKYKKNFRELPKNINKVKNGYNVTIYKNKNRKRKNFKTLEEAIEYKNKILDNFKNIDNNKEAERLKNITRNIKGQAIIKMKCGLDCIVDDHVWLDISKYKWNAILDEQKNIIYYPKGYIGRDNFWLHRYIYEKYIGPVPDNMTVDHIKSHKILDVRLKNLRLANRSLQSHNKNKLKTLIDKYKGVVFTGNSFSTEINGKYYGRYETAEEAAEKANEVFINIYGLEAKLNNIDFTKRTTKDNRMTEEMITKDFILNITTVINLKNVITIKKLNVTNGGFISLSKVKLCNLEEYKSLIINKLF